MGGQRILLLAGGWSMAWQGTRATLAFDVASGTWRTAGEHCAADSRDGGLSTGSVVYQGRLMQWCVADNMGHVEARPLRWLAPTPMDAQQSFGPVRGGVAFLPASAKRPAWLVGGAYEGGVATAAVDAVRVDGRVDSLMPLQTARAGAAVFDLDVGVVVVGGQGRLRGAPDESRAKLPMEWLPGDSPSRGWRGTRLLFADSDVVAQAGTDALLTLHADGSMERIERMAVQGDELAWTTVPLPPLPRARSAGPGAGRIALRRLDDGRVIVAGGVLQTDSLALFGPQVMGEGASDRFVPDGAATAWTDYDILDPKSGQWARSAAAGAPGGLPLVLADGRVLKLTFDEFQPPQAADGSWPVVKAGTLEVSSADGTRWSSFPSPAPLIRLDDTTRLFELDGVLFMSGQQPQLHTGSPRRLLAFDPAPGSWKVLWEARPQVNWRALQGRVVLVTLASGRRLAVPLEGP